MQLFEKKYSVQELIEVIENAKNDKKVAAILVKIKTPMTLMFGQVQVRLLQPRRLILNIG